MEKQVIGMSINEMVNKIRLLNNQVVKNIDFGKCESILLENASKEDRVIYQDLRKLENEKQTPQIQFRLAELLIEFSNNEKENRKERGPICQQRRGYRGAALFYAIKAVNQGYIPAFELEETILHYGGDDIKTNKELAQLLLLYSAQNGDAGAIDRLIYEFKTERYPHNCMRLFDYDPEMLDFWCSKMENSEYSEIHPTLLRYFREKDIDKALKIARKMVKTTVYNCEDCRVIIDVFTKSGKENEARELLKESLNINDANYLYELIRYTKKETLKKINKPYLILKILKKSECLGCVDAKLLRSKYWSSIVIKFSLIIICLILIGKAVGLY